jgi:hypothetical protein
VSAGPFEASPEGNPQRVWAGYLWCGVVSVLVLAVLASVTGPWIAASALGVAIAGGVGAGQVRVNVATWPPPAVWWGRVDVLNVTGRDLRIGAVRARAFKATFDGVRVDPVALYLKRRMVVRALDRASATITVGQGALADALAATSSMRDVDVVLGRGRVRVAATVSVLGGSLRASGEGRLVLRRGTAVDLEFDRIAVAGVPLPRALTSQVNAAVNPVLDVGALPFGLRLRAVRVTDGAVTLDADASGAGG